jgi:hypothetical protein
MSIRRVSGRRWVPSIVQLIERPIRSQFRWPCENEHARRHRIDAKAATRPGVPTSEEPADRLFAGLLPAGFFCGFDRFGGRRGGFGRRRLDGGLCGGLCRRSALVASQRRCEGAAGARYRRSSTDRTHTADGYDRWYHDSGALHATSLRHPNSSCPLSLRRALRSDVSAVCRPIGPRSHSDPANISRKNEPYALFGRGPSIDNISRNEALRTESEHDPMRVTRRGATGKNRRRRLARKHLMQ